MPRPSTSPTAWGAFGPDPGPGIRVLIALLLRFGIGLSLLNTGLAGYMNVRGPLVVLNTSIANVSYTGLDPLLAALPYLAIGLGLALILGFLTTPSAVAAGFFGLLTPLMTTVSIVSIGSMGGGGGPAGMWPGRMGGDPFQHMMVMMSASAYLPSLVPQIALIWLSPLENHPYSIDSLIYGRNAAEIAPPAPPPEPVVARPEVPDRPAS